MGATRSRTANIISLQSSFIEEPPKKLRPKSDNHGEASSVDSAATPLDKDIDELVQKQSDAEKARLLDSLASITSTLAEKVGAVDESRIAFPEISTGEVPRLYSNLKYEKSADGKISASKHASGSTLEATALIAGTTLGVCMLHLPSAMAPSGFLYSSAAMVPSYIYSVMSGLLIAELCINRMGRTGKSEVRLMEIYNESLGSVSSAIGTVAYFGLQFAVILACVATGGANLEILLDSMGMGGVLDSVSGLQQLLFAGAAGAAAYVIRPSERDLANSVMLILAVAALLGIFGVGAGSADFAALIASENQHPEFVIDSLPIVFMALGYQQVMPKITTQLEGDKGKITTAVIAGTGIPFLLYIIWNAIVIGNTLTGPGPFPAGADPVFLLQNEGSPLLGGLVGGFSGIVAAGTLFSVSGNFVDDIADTLKLPSGQELGEWKPVLFAGTLLPAAFLAADSNINGFCRALDYSGAFCISTLFLVLPSIMIWTSRYGDDESPLTVKPLVPFGKISLGSLWKAAGTLIIEQGAEKLGVIDFFKDQFFH